MKAGNSKHLPSPVEGNNASGVSRSSSLSSVREVVLIDRFSAVLSSVTNTENLSFYSDGYVTVSITLPPEYLALLRLPERDGITLYTDIESGIVTLSGSASVIQALLNEVNLLGMRSDGGSVPVSMRVTTRLMGRIRTTRWMGAPGRIN